LFFFEKGGKSYIDGALGATFRRLLKTKGKLEKKKKMSSLPPEMLKIKEKNGIFFLWGLEEMVGGVEDALVHDGLDVHSRAENVSSSSRPPSFFVLLRLKGDQSRHPLLRSQNPFDHLVDAAVFFFALLLPGFFFGWPLMGNEQPEFH
jgi:hypothetical protein